MVDKKNHRLLELIEQTSAWVQVQEPDGRYWVQDINGNVIVDSASREHSELIVRLRNYFANMSKE